METFTCTSEKPRPVNGTCLGLSSAALFGATLCCKQQIQNTNDILKLLVCEELRLERQKPKSNRMLLKCRLGCPPSISDHSDCALVEKHSPEPGLTNSLASLLVTPGHQKTSPWDRQQLTVTYPKHFVRWELIFMSFIESLRL